MADQTINMTMHTLNKYDVPCVDVTDYAGTDSGSSGYTFYMQKDPYKYLVRTKIKGAALTGIPGYVYCSFRNDMDMPGGIGYCDYYSLHNGQLLKTVELPFRINMTGNVHPMVHIGNNHVVYSAVEFEGDIPKYNRFNRDASGYLTLSGRCWIEQNFHFPSTVLYLGGKNSFTGTDPVPPRDVPVEAFNPENDTITVPGHTFVEEMYDWILFQGSGIPPGGLMYNHWYVVVQISGDSFKLATTPIDGPYTGTPIDITSQPANDTILIEDNGYYGYDNAVFRDDLECIRPSSEHLNRIYLNRFGSDKQTGRFYYESLPDLTVSNDPSTESLKRVAQGYVNLLVGALAPGTDYTVEVPFYTFLPPSYPDRLLYDFVVNIFNDNVDDGSNNYVVGSGRIHAHWFESEMLICVSFDDIRGGSQTYQKWFSALGSYLYTWSIPSAMYRDNAIFYVVYPRIDYALAFYYLAVNPDTGDAHLYHYHLLTGALLSHDILDNPTLSENNTAYRLSNQQLIAGKYLMVHTTSSLHRFFDVGHPRSGVVGEITMEGVDDEYGFFVIPEIQV